MGKAMRIKRHDIHRHTCTLPMPLAKPEYWPAERLALLNPVYKDGKIAYYEGSVYADMQWAELQGKQWYGRTDILLLNVDEKCECGRPCCSGKVHRQHCVYPTKNGGISGDLSKFEKSDLNWAREESARIWELALNEPLFMRAMGW